MTDEHDDNAGAVAPWADTAGITPFDADSFLTGFEGLARPASGGLPFLGLGKDGRWKYGPEAIEPEAGSLWAIDPRTLKAGVTAWVDGKVAGEEMWGPRETRKTVAQMSIERPGLPWQEQNSVELKCISGDDAGLVVLFKQSSLGGRKAWSDWYEAAKRQVAVDKAHPVAIVKLALGGYQHKKYGWTAEPKFQLVRWAVPDILTNDKVAASAAAALQTPPAAANGQRTKTAAEPQTPPQAAPEPAQAAPRGNRRPRTRSVGETA